MKQLSFYLLLIILILFGPVKSSAQATRTWVSGVGDDVNPCSRTAPCKTFAGAISKTASGGEISILDPGGFGTVTITKSITIDGGGLTGSILSSLTNGITINAGSDGIVVIRNLSINGAGNGIHGIRVMAAKRVQIENCTISNVTQKGIEINTTTPCAVVLNNVTIHNADDAISINNAAGSVVISNCTFQSVNNNGINLSSGQVTVNHSILSDCKVAVNAAAGTTARLVGNTITDNATALQGSGSISSSGNNSITGNKAPGVNPAIVKQQ